MVTKEKVFELRSLLRSDMPSKRRSADSLKLPVIYEGKERRVCDIHFGPLSETHVWLEDNNGVPTPITDISFIIGSENVDDLRMKIERLEEVIGSNQRRLHNLRHRLMNLRRPNKNMLKLEVNGN